MKAQKPTKREQILNAILKILEYAEPEEYFHVSANLRSISMALCNFYTGVSTSVETPVK